MIYYIMGGDSMEELVNLFVNNGVAVACLIYFMWYNNTTMKEFTNKFDDMNNNIISLLAMLQKEKTTK